MIKDKDTVRCVECLEQYPQSVNMFNKDGYTPFLIACANGNTQIVKVMLRKGADIKLKSKYNESPFYLATFYYIKYPHLKNATCLRELYYAGANIDEPNNKGLTPLQMAAMFGHTSLAKWLLRKHASTNVIPDPYLIAISQGHQGTAIAICKMSKVYAIDYAIE
ncbi:ankyrin-1-like isoform X2 [Diorhabda sublineata]|nr:ankyrin-1-like isoform X2 [Diorhabda sublineata]